MGVTEAKVSQDQDEMLFESQIEFTGATSQGAKVEQGDIGNMLIIGICIIVVMTYIVYAFQKRSIAKVIKESELEIKALDE